MNESRNAGESEGNKEEDLSSRTIELLASQEEESIGVMKDADGMPRYVYPLPEKITVDIDPAMHDGAITGKVTHIDPTTQRGWILYRIPSRGRPAYGWVGLKDVRPALTCTVKNDLHAEGNTEDTVEFVISAISSSAHDLVDGKRQVTPREKVIPFSHPKHPYITGIRHLTKKVTGVCIFSRTANQHVAATVSVVDSELDYFLAEYVVDGTSMHKWLTGDEFTPELIIKRD